MRSLYSISGGPERKLRKRQKHQGEKRLLTLSSNNELQYSRNKCRGEEIEMPSTSGHNLRPRRGAKVRGIREHQYIPYIGEQARSGGQTHYCQDRKGGTYRRSQSLEVLVGHIS
ncbi:hypothetical protein TNIN_421891 [Trichonephila inaurata madagascariensis]|uniref:Uncharacterized protein n=1 Tax=Trichonephila inaurata madagascariensis TaxID=2747483 RepID=A0A8X6YSC4_9ARAC|nr:hypothetical protein TNIN_421891 [Trichonephila inaurata madagascariensis]